MKHPPSFKTRFFLPGGVLSGSCLCASEKALCTVFAASLLQDSAQVHGFRCVACRAWGYILPQWVIFASFFFADSIHNVFVSDDAALW